ncbi:MAG TPA: aspartyl protease family protein [Gemmatimonadales bacterium]|nr:aspartyl protease family protein [Gemmatimonadales bacterium]
MSQTAIWCTVLTSVVLSSGRALAQQQLSASALAPRRVDLPVQGATVPLHLIMQDRATVEVMVNGRGPFVFAIETGAPIVLVTERMATELHLPADNPSSVDSLRIGDLVLRDLPVVKGPELLPGVDGLLGLTAYRDLLLTVDYPALSVRFERGALGEPNGRDVFALVEMGQHLGVDVDIGGRRYPAVLDTQGSAAIDCAPEVADSLRFVSGRVPTGSASIGGQPPVPVFSARLDGDVRLGATTIQRPIVGIVSPPPGFPRELLLGARLLRHFVITLDQRNKRIRVNNPDGVIPPPPGLRSIGLALAPAPQGGVDVAATRADGAAYASGLRVGDEVVTIAGRPGSEFLQPAALPTLVQSANVVRFEVRRNGRSMAFDVVPTVLIP